MIVLNAELRKAFSMAGSITWHPWIVEHYSAVELETLRNEMTTALQGDKVSDELLSQVRELIAEVEGLPDDWPIRLVQKTATRRRRS